MDDCLNIDEPFNETIIVCGQKDDEVTQKMKAVIHNQIENTAYKLWEDAGRPDGRSEEFWLEAEKRFQERVLGRSLLVYGNKNDDLFVSPEAMLDIKSWPEPSTDPQPFTKKLISLAKLVTRRQEG